MRKIISMATLGVAALVIGFTANGASTDAAEGANCHCCKSAPACSCTCNGDKAACTCSEGCACTACGAGCCGL